MPGTNNLNQTRDKDLYLFRESRQSQGSSMTATISFSSIVFPHPLTLGGRGVEKDVGIPNVIRRHLLLRMW